MYPFTDTWRSEIQSVQKSIIRHGLEIKMHIYGWSGINRSFPLSQVKNCRNWSSVGFTKAWTTGEWSIAGELPAALYAADLAISSGFKISGIYCFRWAMFTLKRFTQANDLLPS